MKLNEDQEIKLGIDEWDIKAWIIELGSIPIERIRHADCSQGYDVNVAHVFKLESGKFATVIEEGCSCYVPDNARIEVFPTEDRALQAFKRWESENKET